jgi:hypothetical protein
VHNSEGLNLGKGNGGEDECGEENYDGEGTHGAQYGRGVLGPSRRNERATNTHFSSE